MAYLGQENIYSFENFINEEDRKELIRFYDNDFQWNGNCSWIPPVSQYNKGDVTVTGKFAEDVQAREDTWPEGATHPLMYEYGKKIVETASKTFERTLVHRLQPYMKKFDVGTNHDPHADSEAVDRGVVDFMPKFDPLQLNTPITIEVAANLYLNDDFGGGELWFPIRELEIKPKAGQLILFLGGHEYIHGVKEITSGARYVLFTPLTTPKLLFLQMHVYNLAHELKELKEKWQLSTQS